MSQIWDSDVKYFRCKINSEKVFVHIIALLQNSAISKPVPKQCVLRIRVEIVRTQSPLGSSSYAKPGQERG